MPRAVALLLAGALSVEGQRVAIDAAVAAAAATPAPRRALLSVSDKAGLAAFGSALVARGFELVSTGGTARALREAGLPVTDVAAVTGFPEMLDGRVKTLHPRVHGGILADRRLPAHREQLAAAGIEPFELVVVNLYPFAAAAERALRGELDLDGLVEEIDIGGPSMVRAAAKNHASVAIVTDPGALRRRPGGPRRSRARSRPACARRSPWRRSGTRRPTTPGSPRCCPERMAAEGVALPDEPGLPGAADPFPTRLTVTLERVETLRYGENPAPARGALPAPGCHRRRRPLRDRRPAAAGEGAQLQQRPRRLGGRRDRAPAARACLRDRQAHEPLWRRRAGDARRGLGRRPRGGSGLGVRRRRRAHPAGRPRDRRSGWRASSSRSWWRRRSSPAALEVLAAKAEPAPGRGPRPGAAPSRSRPRPRPARCAPPAGPSS